MVTKRKAKKILIVTTGAALVVSIVALLYYHGILLFNNPSIADYPVRGVDVASYQGEIDWSTLQEQGIRFAFIKATEGSDVTDRCFAQNFKNSHKEDLRVGAYHFFSDTSSGESQANHFISVVPQVEGMLPPVVDVEFYGDIEKKLPNKGSIQAQLHILIDKLHEHYGLKPIIYATEKAYELFIADDFQTYDIWIRNVISKPRLSDSRDWTFWQYTNRQAWPGYSGRERFIDVNVFAGTEAEFAAYGRMSAPSPQY